MLQRILIGKKTESFLKINSGSFTLKCTELLYFVLVFKFVSPDVNLKALQL